MPKLAARAEELCGAKAGNAAALDAALVLWLDDLAAKTPEITDPMAYLAAALVRGLRRKPVSREVRKPGARKITDQELDQELREYALLLYQNGAPEAEVFSRVKQLCQEAKSKRTDLELKNLWRT